MKATIRKSFARFNNVLIGPEMKSVTGGMAGRGMRVETEIGDYIYTEYYDSNGNLTSFSIYNKTTNETTFC